jgi:hypothetical protein
MAALNKMTINMAKTKEVVFRRFNPKIDVTYLLCLAQKNYAKLNCSE